MQTEHYMANMGRAGHADWVGLDGLDRPQLVASTDLAPDGSAGLPDGGRDQPSVEE